jgi:hypothetical protein
MLGKLFSAWKKAVVVHIVYAVEDSSNPLDWMRHASCCQCGVN